jgi:hypothetical protein
MRNTSEGTVWAGIRSQAVADQALAVDGMLAAEVSASQPMLPTPMSAIRRFFKFWGHALSYDNVGNLGELQRRWEDGQDRDPDAASIPQKSVAASSATRTRLPAAVAALHGTGALH